MTFLKHALITVLLAAVVAVAAGAWIIIGGRFDVAVSAQLPEPVHEAIHRTRVNAVRHRARDLQARPADLDDPATLLDAVAGFEAMCADCHHAPGGAPSALARGLNPKPADLTEAAGKRSLEELFWVSKYGIRMSGMPGWGKTHDDAELWALATLITRFPQLSADAYEQLRSEASEAGVTHHHHDQEIDHEDDQKDNREHHH